MKNRLHIVAVLFLCMLSSCTVFRHPQPNMQSREGIVPGEQITVQKTQNVYAVAKQYNVSMRDLIVLNDLSPPFSLHMGQKLTLPAGHRAEGDNSGPSMSAPNTASVGSVEQTTLAPIEMAPPPPVTRGQTQYTNTPQPPPQPGVKPSVPSAEALTTPSPVRQVPTTAPSSGQRVAAINPSTMQPLSQPPEEAPAITLAWPVQGPVVSGFGPKGQGLNNDGINIGAPKGAPVVAAASGIVVYAGNEMKGFGNLILIRHEGGWVTAYAHLDRALVNKDAVVAQGDMIGTVGKTGNVGSPQLHFEVRYQGKPVDPAGLIKSN